MVLEFNVVVMLFARCGWSKRHSRAPEQVAAGAVSICARLHLALPALWTDDLEKCSKKSGLAER